MIMMYKNLFAQYIKTGVEMELTPVFYMIFRLIRFIRYIFPSRSQFHSHIHPVHLVFRDRRAAVLV